MSERMPYNIDGEKFWFPFENGTTGEISTSLNPGNYPSVHFARNSDVYSYTGFVIPAGFIRSLELPAISSPDEIQRLIFQLIPKYGQIKRYHSCVSCSPIEAVEKGLGDCIERTSIAAAIAVLNDLPYRIVGSDNIAPPRSAHDARLTLMSYWARYCQGLFTKSSQLSYSKDMFRRPYPHWWVEIYHNDSWVSVDTVEWNPVSFRPFSKSVQQNKIICLEKEVSFDFELLKAPAEESILRLP